jgi:hypothetical protein
METTHFRNAVVLIHRIMDKKNSARCVTPSSEVFKLEYVFVSEREKKPFIDIICAEFFKGLDWNSRERGGGGIKKAENAFCSVGLLL